MVYIVNTSLRAQVNLSTILTHAVVKILMYGERMINKNKYSYLHRQVKHVTIEKPLANGHARKH